MKPHGYGSYKANLLGKPSVTGDYCAVCGAYATDGHHTVQKGIGGVSKDVDRQIPIIGLCRTCHDLHHARRLHFNFDGGRWMWFVSGQQMSDEAAWKLYRSHYTPVAEPIEYVTFGRRS